MSKFRDLLKPVSRIRYLAWRMLGARRPITMILKSGLQLQMRSGSATDYGVAYDVFLRNCYYAPEPVAGVESIVDLGANVGYSCLFWCQQYPQANVIAFEPHPDHLTAIAEHLAINHVSNRVQVVDAAAGTAETTACLSDAGSSSSISSTPGGHTVPVLDLFEKLKGRIDLLKMDIEGGEYDLLADPRFGSLGARIVVVEWHRKPGQSDGREWCREKLQQFGYRTVTGIEDLPLAGLIWGFKEDQTRNNRPVVR